MGKPLPELDNAITEIGEGDYTIDDALAYIFEDKPVPQYVLKLGKIK